MNENLKLVLIAAGILAIYHFFFRSIVPVKVNGSTGESIADGLTDAPDFGSEDKTVITTRPDGLSTITSANGSAAVGADSRSSFSRAERVSVLQG